VPGVLVGAGERRQGREHGRQQFIAVAARRGSHATGDEVRSVLQEPDEIVDLFDDLEGDRREIAEIRQEEDRAARPESRGLDERSRACVVVVIDVPVEQDGIQAGIGGDDRGGVV